MRRFLCALTVLLCVGLSPAEAYEPDAADTANVEQTVQVFSDALRSGDYNRVIDAVPPKILTFIAEAGGVEIAELRALMVEQLGEGMQAVEVVDFSFDVADAEWAVTETGRQYAIVPTKLTMKLANSQQIVDSESFTLALSDDNAWYLVRMDDFQQLTILTLVYPDFLGVSFPAGSHSVRN